MTTSAAHLLRLLGERGVDSAFVERLAQMGPHRWRSLAREELLELKSKIPSDLFFDDERVPGSEELLFELADAARSGGRYATWMIYARTRKNADVFTRAGWSAIRARRSGDRSPTNIAHRELIDDSFDAGVAAASSEIRRLGKENAEKEAATYALVQRIPTLGEYQDLAIRLARLDTLVGIVTELGATGRDTGGLAG